MLMGKSEKEHFGKVKGKASPSHPLRPIQYNKYILHEYKISR